MRRITLIALIAVGSLLASSAGGAASPDRTIRLVDRDPLVLRGEGFRPGERVRVSLSAPVVERKWVRATAKGAFRATFLDVSADRCEMVRALAVGGTGSRASVKYLPAPACAPPLSTP